MTYLEKAIELKKKIDENQAIVNTINDAGGIRACCAQSDKVGYNWKLTYVGETVIMKEYVAQKEPIGIYDNPFEWADGITMVPNAYYELDGVKKVWMGSFDVLAEWNDENLVEF